MNHSLPETHSFHELRDELREVADTWRSAVFGTAMGVLFLFTNTWALQGSRAGRKIFRRPGREAPGNWRR